MFKTGTVYLNIRQKIMGKWHSRIDKCLIDVLCLVVALCLLRHLLFEARPLLKGVIQFSVCVAKLLSAHKTLEAFAEAGACSVPLSQGGHDLWVAD
jgi:hypothetical protein